MAKLFAKDMIEEALENELKLYETASEEEKATILRRITQLNDALAATVKIDKDYDVRVLDENLKREDLDKRIELERERFEFEKAQAEAKAKAEKSDRRFDRTTKVLNIVGGVGKIAFYGALVWLGFNYEHDNIIGSKTMNNLMTTLTKPKL